MQASEVLNYLVEDFPHVAAIKTFSTGSPVIDNFDVNSASHFILLTYTTNELGRNSEYKSLDDVELALSRIGDKYDLIFVDPWHTYKDSLKCIEIATKYCKPNGFVIVHDCLALDSSMSAEYVPGLWSGVTSIAFRDYVANINRNWCVMDSDYGVGIIGPEYSSESKLDLPEHPDWARASLDEKIKIFYDNPIKLMRAIAPSQFLPAIQQLKTKGDVKSLSSSYNANPRNYLTNTDNSENQKLLQELNAIKNSRIWKATALYRRIRSNLRFK